MDVRLQIDGWQIIYIGFLEYKMVEDLKSLRIRFHRIILCNSLRLWYALHHEHEEIYSINKTPLLIKKLRSERCDLDIL